MNSLKANKCHVHSFCWIKCVLSDILLANVIHSGLPFWKLVVATVTWWLVMGVLCPLLGYPPVQVEHYKFKAQK